MSHYQETLYHIIHENRMYGYEENNMAFITSKLINLNKDLDRPLSLIIRSDYIVDDTYWLIRYFRSRQVEPAYLLSTSSVKQEFGYFLGIPIITVDELNMENTKNCILIYLNRESDRKIFTQKDYRESDYNFVLRARGSLQFARGMGVRNYAYILKNEEEYYSVLEKLADEESKKSFIEVIRRLLENDIYRYHEYESALKYFDDSIYKPLYENEAWINCGTSTGDTVLHYLSLGRNYKKIYAVETGRDLVKYLETLFELLPDGRDRIEIYDKAFEGRGSKYNVDTVFADEQITLINMDIEGAEMLVLEGASEKIKKDLPVLAIAAYHKPGDLLEIPKFISSLSDEYHFFFRKYRGWAPDVINEYVYYAVPTNRLTEATDYGRV